MSAAEFRTGHNRQYFSRRDEHNSWQSTQRAALTAHLQCGQRLLPQHAPVLAWNQNVYHSWLISPSKMYECIGSLRDAAVITTLDIKWGYWHLSVSEGDKNKTTFTSHAGTHRFDQMPFGHMNAPKTFKRALDIILNKYTWKFCIVYLNDIIIFSNDNDQHL